MTDYRKQQRNRLIAILAGLAAVGLIFYFGAVQVFAPSIEPEPRRSVS